MSELVLRVGMTLLPGRGAVIIRLLDRRLVPRWNGYDSRWGR